MLNIYNKQLLILNDPRFIYNKLKIVFDNLGSFLFIFPEELDLELDDGDFYTYLNSSLNFNDLKIYSLYFKPYEYIDKIFINHIGYLNNLNSLYSKYDSLSDFSSCRKFLNGFNLNQDTKNYLKHFINNEDLVARCGKRPFILNYISNKFLLLFVEKYTTSLKFELYNSVSKLNYSDLKFDFDNSIKSEDLAKIVLKKVLKINNYSDEYYEIIKYLFENNMDKIKSLINEFIKSKVNNYFFFDINHKIIENLNTHITYNMMNYPKNIFYFVNKETVVPPPKNGETEEFIIENFSNIAFDLNNDGVVDEIWDPDDDNDYVSLLRRLNPKLDEYYKSYFVIADNKTFDYGSYLSHVKILENQLFLHIKQIIESRTLEYESLNIVSGQFCEKDSVQYLNSLIFTYNKYVNDILDSEIYDEIYLKYLPDRVVNMLIRNIYIDNDLINLYFKNYNFKYCVKNSKAIELAVLNKFTSILNEFFESDKFKKYLLTEFFTQEYLNNVKLRFPNVRDDLINNLNNLINNFKFTFSNDIYNGDLFKNITTKFYQIYETAAPHIKDDDFTDIYENYLSSSNLLIDSYRDEIKNILVSGVYSILLDEQLDELRVNKKYVKI